MGSWQTPLLCEAGCVGGIKWTACCSTMPGSAGWAVALCCASGWLAGWLAGLHASPSMVQAGYRRLLEEALGYLREPSEKSVEEVGAGREGAGRDGGGERSAGGLDGTEVGGHMVGVPLAWQAVSPAYAACW